MVHRWGESAESGSLWKKIKLRVPPCLYVTWISLHVATLLVVLIPANAVLAAIATMGPRHCCNLCVCIHQSLSLLGDISCGPRVHLFSESSSAFAASSEYIDSCRFVPAAWINSLRLLMSLAAGLCSSFFFLNHLSDSAFHSHGGSYTLADKSGSPAVEKKGKET